MSEESKDPFAAFSSEPQPPASVIDGYDEAMEEFCNSYKQNDNVESLTDSMNKYDATVVNTQIIRQKLTNKLLTDVMRMDLSEAAKDADLFAAHAKMISETRGLLNDIDNSSRNHTAVKLKHKDTESQASMAFSAAELLSKIKANDIQTSGTAFVDNSTELEKLIENQFDDPGTVVLDTELEVGTSMLPKQNKEEF